MDSLVSVLEVKGEFELFFPDFSEWLSKESIYYTSDSDGNKIYDYCGLFLELTHFLDEMPSLWSETAFTELASICESALINSHSGRDPSQDDLLGAVEICFLENLSGREQLTESLRPYLKPRSRYALDLDTR